MCPVHTLPSLMCPASDGMCNGEIGVVALVVKLSRGCGTLAGESTDLSFLDPINRADTPPRAIQLAAAELSLRIEQNRLRLNTGLGEAVNTILRRRMCGKVGASLNTFMASVDCLPTYMWEVQQLMVSCACRGDGCR